MSNLRRLAFGLLAATTIAVAPTAAQADIYDRFSYTDSGTGTFLACGTAWSFDFRASGTVLLRLDDDGDILLAQDNGSFTNTVTNLETGRHITFSGHSLFREVESVRDGDILTVDVRQSGMPVVVKSDTGKVIARDRGLIVFRQTLQVVDHDIVFLSEEVVADRGGHPLYYAPFCEVAVPATT